MTEIESGSAPLSVTPRWGLVVATPLLRLMIRPRSVGWHAMGVSAATAAATFMPIDYRAAPVLYLAFAVRMHRIRL